MPPKRNMFILLVISCVARGKGLVVAAPGQIWTGSQGSGFMLAAGSASSTG